jgi:hypothetical protein
MKDSASTQPAGEGNPTEQDAKGAEQAAGYSSDERFTFCPQKELNLPASYDEVLSRFKRLQAGRAMESLN